jgi:uncharacterized membrane protein YphA (DoxX/SURF4 family)
MSAELVTAGAQVPSQKKSKGLDISLWVAQVALAFAFGMAGFMKVTKPIAELGQQMGWVKFYSPQMVRFIGTVEILGALGLILPAVTRFLPRLTALAAAGLTLVMLGAIEFHLTHNDLQHIAPAIVLAALSTFVAWGRFKKAPIAPR